MAEFLAGASGWYEHEPQKSLNQRPASALRLIGLRAKPAPRKHDDKSFTALPFGVAWRQRSVISGIVILIR